MALLVSRYASRRFRHTQPLLAVSGLSHQDHPGCNRMIFLCLPDLDTGVSYGCSRNPFRISFQKASGPGIFHITLDRLLHSLLWPPAAINRWHKPTTTLRYRCSIKLSQDGIHSPFCVPVASGTYGFLGFSSRSATRIHPLFADANLSLTIQEPANCWSHLACTSYYAF